MPLFISLFSECIIFAWFDIKLTTFWLVVKSKKSYKLLRTYKPST